MAVHACPDPTELAKLIAQNVQTYGWHVTYLSAADGVPGGAYTIGLFETFRHPEVSVFGLGDDVLVQVVNSLAKNVQAGQRYQAGFAYNDIIDGVSCIFHSVEALWLPYFFGIATRFYQDREFAMLQCLWPDKQQKFPWSYRFHTDWLKAQPWLFRSYLTDARTEPFLKASPDTEDLLRRLKETEHELNSLGDTTTSGCTKHRISPDTWPFENPKRLLACALGNSGGSGAPITGVSREDDSTWLFFSGEQDVDAEEVREVCLGCVLQVDPSISEVADLPRGWMAKRTRIGGRWLRRQIPPDEK